MGFNLCDEPWIPIAGSRERKSLIECFTGPPPFRLSGNAVDKIVILRLLLAVVHAANRIPDVDAWCALTPEIMAENARDYLEKHRDCFELYGERPFLQFPQLAKGKIKNFYDADGLNNRSVLSGWGLTLARPLSDAEKTVFLLRSACFARGGKRFDTDLCLSPGVVKGKTGKAGTLLGKDGFLHAYMLGGNLWETLRLNLLTESELREINAWPDGVGVPFWEAMPSGEADARAEKYRRSYQGQLFPLDKFLLLNDGGIIETSGIAYPGYNEGLVDPALTITNDGKNIRPVWAKTDMRPWRELAALLAFLKNEPPIPYFLSMGKAKRRRLHAETFAIWVGGVAVSDNSGEQSIKGMNDYVESEFAFPVEQMRTEWYLKFCGFMEEIENSAKRLFNCVFKYHEKMSGEYKAKKKPFSKAQGERAKALFWERMEPHAQEIIDLAFSEHFDESATNRARTGWFKLLCQVYEECCPRDTPRQFEKWVECHPGFQSAKKKGDK